MAEHLIRAGTHYRFAMIPAAFVQAVIATPLNALWTFRSELAARSLNLRMIWRGTVVDLAGWLGAEILVSVEIDILAEAWNMPRLRDFAFARGVAVLLLGYPLYLFDLWHTYKIPLRDLPPVAMARRVYAKLRSILVR